MTTTQSRLYTPVLIAGGGLVGLMVACELAYRGVDFMLVNDQPTTSPHPQGNTFNSRTMEHYRRLGFADKIRQLGLPPDLPTDTVYITRFTGWELARLAMPSSNEKIKDRPNNPHAALTPEPIHRCSFFYGEPVLKAHAERFDGADIRFGWRLDGFTDHGDHVEASITEVATGGTEIVTCRYLVGCDGPHSGVRKALGIGLGGKGGEDKTFMMGRMLSTYVEAPTLKDIMAHKLAWNFWTVNKDARAHVLVLDGISKYGMLIKMPDGAEARDMDPVGYLKQVVGADIPIELISAIPWTAGLALVADNYQQGRVFMAGDAIHLFTPTGGFGMNTGTDDAANLGWKLAAVIKGWAPESLLDTYQLERKPIGHRNTAMSHEFASAVAGLEIPKELEDDSAGGEAARARLGKHLSGFTEEFRALGIQLGARYDTSPLIAGDKEAPPEDSPFDYVPSAVPGGRAPHVWLDDGRALFDLFGPDFTLLKLDVAAETDTLEQAARTRGLPLETAICDLPAARGLYGRKLALIRPDGHICWRGDRTPDDPDRLLDQVTGGMV
jgi:2-polyprenyl-6-methoxyphenol hydroxylase-like FAD-dependent oxidoreductase